MMTKIVRHYPKLRLALKAEQLHYSEIARNLNRSTSYIDHVMSGDVSPRLSECYAILSLVGISPERIGEYFTEVRK